MDQIGQVLVVLLSWILLGLGYAFTIGLLCVPFIRLNALSKGEDGADHLPFLYIMSLVNALAWLSYGCLDQMSKAVIFINLIACLFHLSYSVWYLWICNSPCIRMFIALFLAVVLFVSLIMAGIRGLLPGVLPRGRDSISTGVTITAILMYIGPVPDTLAAVWTGDAGRMSLPIIIVSLGNAICWGEYGRLQGKAQDTIRFPNEVGAGISLIQLVIYHGLRRNDDIGEIYSEIPQLYHQITEAMSQAWENVSQAVKNGYAALRGDDEEKDGDD